MTSTFTFVGHTLDTEKGNATFSYRLEHSEKVYDFVETLQFTPIAIADSKSEVLNTILDNLLLVLGVSYWKTFCPKVIKMPTIALTKSQAEFWSKLYTKGLGEFFYKNDIDYRWLINFPYEGRPLVTPPPVNSFTVQEIKKEEKNKNRSLVFFGGGKDAIVTAELLKKRNKEFSLFMVNSSPIQEETAKIVGKESIVIHRTIDPQLFSLSDEGAYNGHIPISAVWSCIGLLAAHIYDYSYLISSNEHSANYGNVEYLGQEINHQWSKSLEFETLFQNYITENITTSITYFSMLRSFYEIKIVKLFTQYPQYFPYFSSCNTNFKIDSPSRENDNRWCGKCSKCLFVFTLLAGFLDKKTVISIFGKNLFEETSLLNLFEQLLDTKDFKPFDCVGTPDETKLALYKAFQKGEHTNTPLMDFFEKQILPTIKNVEELENELLTKNQENKIPEEFLDTLALV